MIYGLIFLGATTATSRHQRDGILAYAKKRRLKINQFISYDDAPDMTLFKSGDTVVCFSWRCICNKQALLEPIVQYFLANNIQIHSATSKYRVDATRDFEQFKYAFELYEDMRFNFSSTKGIETVQMRTAGGYPTGRPFGSKNKRYVVEGKESSILQMHSDGVSINAIAKTHKISATTVRRFLRAQN